MLSGDVAPVGGLCWEDKALLPREAPGFRCTAASLLQPFLRSCRPRRPARVHLQGPASVTRATPRKLPGWMLLQMCKQQLQGEFATGSVDGVGTRGGRRAQGTRCSPSG